MPRKRDGVVPFGDGVWSGEQPGGHGLTSRPAMSPARRPFTRRDQVTQLVGASEADAEVGFMARLMALCSLPRTNPGTRHQYTRVNGPYTLIMSTTGEYKLPFGNLPRLLLAWVCTEAVRTQSRVLMLGDSLSAFMRTLGVVDTGGHTQTRLRNQMNRLFHSSVELTYKHESGSHFVASRVVDQGDFWWDPKRPDDRTLWENTIELGEKFFQEIITHPVPLDMHTLKALKRSPLGLDLYFWLTYRTFRLKSPLRLPWPMLYQQFGADPSKANNPVTVRNFRMDCLRELAKIKTAWPGMQYRTGRGVLILLPSLPCIPPRHQFTD